MRPSTPLAVLCCLLLASPSKGDEPPKHEPGVLANLIIEGATTFDAHQIRGALRRELDVRWELDRNAAPNELAEVLRQKIRAGFRHAGFPDARIDVTTDRNKRLPSRSSPAPPEMRFPDFSATRPAEAIVVNVHEGPRFRSGRIRVEGARRIPIGEVIEALTEPFPPRDAIAHFHRDEGTQAIRWTDADKDEAKYKSPVWTPGDWASFADAPRKRLEQRIRTVLTDYGFPSAEFQVQLERHETPGTADLVIVIDDEHRQAKIERIELIGNERNSREAVLAYLQVQPSTVFTREERLRIEGLLWRSGRFADYDIQLVQPDGESFVLQIQVRECADVSPVDQPLTRAERTLLKTRDWLSRFEHDGYDIVLRTDSFECALAPRQGIMLVQKGEPEDGQSTVQQAAMLVPGRFGLYDFNSGRKLVLSLPTLQLELDFELDVAEDPKRTARGRIGGSIKSVPAGEPPPMVRFTSRLSPAVFMLNSHRWDWVREDGQLVLREGLAVLKIDPRTGQLSGESDASSKYPWRIGFERGAFAAWKTQVLQSAKNIDNGYNAQRVASSLLKFLDKDGEGRPSTEFEKDWVAVLDLFSQLAADGLFDRPLAGTGGKQKQNSAPFSIPGRRENTNDPVGGLATSAYLISSDVFPRGSWAWSIWRSVAALYVADERFHRLGSAGVKQFLRSDEHGPVVDLLICEILKNDSRWSRYVAARGLGHVDTTGFKRDYSPLIDARYLCGEVVHRAADILRRKNSDELDDLFHGTPSPLASDAREVVDYLRRHPEKSTKRLLPEALDHLWESGAQHQVEEALRARASQGDAET